jgi:HemX protein
VPASIRTLFHMTPSQQLLAAATLIFVGAVVHALLALKSGAWKQTRARFVLMALGFVLQTGFIYLRGQEVRQCPIRSLPDILVFIAWSVVLLYLLVGSAYRLSLLGLFTAPLVAIMHAMAFVYGFAPYPPKGPINALVELHIALALISYAAFAMACITGVMYLIQERLLKLHHIGGLFYQLPPIQGLAHAIQRLVRLGLLLLSIALGISFALHLPMTKTGHVVFAWIVWGLYAVTAFLMWRHFTSPRKTAWLAVIGFILPFISLWIVTHA